MFPTADRVYLGGSFATLMGQPRPSFGAVTTAAALLPFHTDTTSNAGGYAIARTASGTLLVGGQFLATGGRRYLEEVDATTGAPRPWLPPLAGSVIAIAVNGRSVWVGGVLIDDGITPLGGLARFLRPAEPPPPGGGPGPGPDTAAPVVTDVALTRRVFRVGRKPTATSARRHRAGTKLRFTLSEAATVRIRVQRARPGRRLRGRCVAPKRSLRRHKRCTRFKGVGTLTRSAVAGPVSVAFSGRIGSRALRRGRHRFVVFAVDAAGNRSARKRIGFRIVRR
jgi:hypothetical protein